jgi:hypothetical protein
VTHITGLNGLDRGQFPLAQAYLAAEAGRTSCPTKTIAEALAADAGTVTAEARR